jgi:hypothetical protein
MASSVGRLPGQRRRRGGVRLKLVGLLLALGLPLSAHGQASSAAFLFADRAQARAVLGARDDYVQATGDLERSVALRSTEAVNEERFAARLADQALAWNGNEQRLLEPLLARLEQFVSGTKWRRPDRILLVKASRELLEGSPHTRANAIILPESELDRGQENLVYIVAHELFHVLSRADAALREELYAAIGFRRCARVELADPLRGLRITNPDAVESRHAIRVRVGDRATEALPFVHLPAGKFDRRAGFVANLTVSWLPVERSAGRCVVAPGATSLRPEQMEGLYEQIGRNTAYIMHPEEILADNFALLFILSAAETPKQVPSPELLQRMKRIMGISARNQSFLSADQKIAVA